MHALIVHFVLNYSQVSLKIFRGVSFGVEKLERKSLDEVKHSFL